MKSFAILSLLALPAVLATDNRRHFYTTNPGGENAKAGGYTEDGPYAYAYTSQVSGTVPMYRCYNGPQDLHFYTTSSNCEGAANYNVETVGWYCYPNQASGTVSLDRYSQRNGDHWYVIRGNERLTSENQGDDNYYNFEGTACWVYSQQTNGASPVYQWHRGTVY